MKLKKLKTIWVAECLLSAIFNSDLSELSNEEVELFEQFDFGMIQNLTEKTDFLRCHVTGLSALCHEIECYDDANKVRNFIIDAETKGYKAIISALKRKKGVLSVEFNGCYHQDVTCCQIIVETTLIKDELEHWLWKRNFNYIGVIEDK